MSNNFKFKITFNYDKEDKEVEASIKAIKNRELREEIGDVRLEKTSVKNGVAVFTGVAVDCLNLECILGFFEDYGRDLVVTWVEERSPDVLPEPVVLTQYVRCFDDEFGHPDYVYKSCCGKYVVPYGYDNPRSIEVYGRDAIKEPWVDIAEGMTFDKFRTDFTIKGRFNPRWMRPPVTEDIRSLNINDFAGVINAKALKFSEKLDKRTGEIHLQGVMDGPLDFVVIKEYLKKYVEDFYIMWFCKDAPETAESVYISTSEQKDAELPVLDTPTCGQISITPRFCKSFNYSTYGKNSCKRWDFVRGLF